MTWAFWIENSAAVQALANAVMAAMSIVGVAGIWLLWTQQRESKKDRREKFYQSLSTEIHAHNWKFLEHWSNAGVRPGMDEALSLEENSEDFGRRVVVLSHVNLLWQVFLHKDHLTSSDIDGFRNWALSWLETSKDQLQILFSQGDLYPLDFISWLRDVIFNENRFQPFVGKGLRGRLEQFER